jgi:hypothetical protein
MSHNSYLEKFDCYDGMLKVELQRYFFSTHDMILNLKSKDKLDNGCLLLLFINEE